MAFEDVTKGMMDAVAGIAANEARKLYEDGVRADAAQAALLEGAQEGVMAGLGRVVRASPSWSSMPDETRWSDAAQRPKRRRRRADPRAEEQMIEDTYAILGVR